MFLAIDRETKSADRGNSALYVPCITRSSPESRGLKLETEAYSYRLRFERLFAFWLLRSMQKHSLTVIANAQVIACTRDNERRRKNFFHRALIEQLVFHGRGTRVSSIDRWHRQTLGSKAADEQRHVFHERASRDPRQIGKSRSGS